MVQSTEHSFHDMKDSNCPTVGRGCHSGRKGGGWFLYMRYQLFFFWHFIVSDHGVYILGQFDIKIKN